MCIFLFKYIYMYIEFRIYMGKLHTVNIEKPLSESESESILFYFFIIIV